MNDQGTNLRSGEGKLRGTYVGTEGFLQFSVLLLMKKSTGEAAAA